MMVKKILIALDPDADTPVATRHAIAIAREHDAAVTGLAIVETGQVESESHGEATIKGVYHTPPLQESLTTQAQKQAGRLLEEFEDLTASAGVPSETLVRQGMPFQRIVELMKYHDLLVIGETPHFFYSQPRQRTKTLTRVISDTLTPVLVVRERTELPVDQVLIAFDGDTAAARTMHAFVHLNPFPQAALTLLHIHDDLPEASQRILNNARAYLSAHGLEAQPLSVEGTRPADHIIAQAEETDADVVVTGVHSVSKLRKMTFGSVTDTLLDDCPASLFVHH